MLKELILFVGLVTLAGAEGEDDQCLAQINEYRKTHHAPELKCDDALKTGATTFFTENRAKAKTGAEDAIASKAGLSVGYAEAADSWKTIVDGWYTNGKTAYEGQPMDAKTGSEFTQMVWVQSTMGCCNVGKSDDEAADTVVIVKYDPEGNVEGQYENNVLSEAPNQSTPDPNLNSTKPDDTPQGGDANIGATPLNALIIASVSLARL